ncbi:MAG: hypothetical protein HRT87_00150 [Legionellales bacterium]|nr:hypothetical protein [Legionellales bacterium]
MISIVIATRTGITDVAGPLPLLRDIRLKSSKDYSFEIIIRGDEDDVHFPLLIKKIQKENFPFKIKFFTGNRGRGYEDLHKFYNDPIIKSEFKITPDDDGKTFGGMGDGKKRGMATFGHDDGKFKKKSPAAVFQHSVKD